MSTLQPQFAEVISYSPLTEAEVELLRRNFSRLHWLILNLDQIDLSKGAGVINHRTKCVWTKDGKRITITASVVDQTVIASCSKETDLLAFPDNRG